MGTYGCHDFSAPGARRAMRSPQTGIDLACHRLVLQPLSMEDIEEITDQIFLPLVKAQ
jgi:hypothetical protein